MAERQTLESAGESPSAVRILPPQPPRGGGAVPPARPPRRAAPNGLLVGVAIVIALGSLLYGYRLGEQNRAADETVVATTVAVAPPTSPPTTAAPTGPFGVTVTEFGRRAPGHDVPEGATEYLNANFISALAVAPDGFIWSAGPGGVVRWNPTDGSYERYTTPDGTGPIGAHDIAVAPDGDVWVARGNGLSHWNGEEWSHDSELSEFGTDTGVTSLAVTADGSVWVASVEWNGFDPWRNEPEFRIHRGDGSFTGDIETYVVPGYVERLMAAPDGSLWALIEGSTIWRFADGRWELAIDPGMQRVHDLAFGPDGSVLLAAERTIRRWADGGFTQIGDAEALIPYDVDGFLAQVVVDEEGTAWAVATTWSEARGEELELIRLDDFTRHPMPDVDLSEDLVAADDRLWAGSDGLVGFDGTSWSHFRLEDDPPLRWTENIAVDERGNLWIASDEALIEFDGATWSAHSRTDLGWPEKEPDAPWGWGWEPAWVTAGPRGHLWAGFGCDAAFLEGGDWVLVGRPPNEEATEWCWPQRQWVGPDGSLWLITEGNLGPRLYRNDGSSWPELARFPGYVESFAVAADGTVWAAGNGILRLDGDEWTTVLGGFEFHDLAVAGDGSLWAAEACWGCADRRARLWHLAEGVWTAEEVLDVDRLRTAPDGTVWAIGRQEDRSGLWRYDPVGIFRLVMSGDGLSDVAFDADGTVWVAAEGRLLHLENAAD